MNIVERRLLRWLQRHCDHPSNEQAADILQRDNLPTKVRWCRTCGAVAVDAELLDGSTDYAELRLPQPTWNR